MATPIPWDSKAFQKLGTEGKLMVMMQELMGMKAEVVGTKDELKQTNEEMKKFNQRMQAVEDNIGTIGNGLEAMGQRMEVVEKRADALDAAIDMGEEQMVAAISAMDNQIREEHLSLQDFDDIENRKRNLCIFGLKEAPPGLTPEGWKKHDEDLVGEIMKVVAPAAQGQVANRLGTKGDKPRPLIVIMKTEAMRDDVLNGLKNLKGIQQWKGVAIALDRTKKQRANDKLTFKEFQKRRDERNQNMNETEKNEYVWVIKGRSGQLYLQRVLKN